MYSRMSSAVRLKTSELEVMISEGRDRVSRYQERVTICSPTPGPDSSRPYKDHGYAMVLIMDKKGSCTMYSVKVKDERKYGGFGC